jgi:hypothetical protein
MAPSASGTTAATRIAKVSKSSAAPTRLVIKNSFLFALAAQFWNPSNIKKKGVL